MSDNTKGTIHGHNLLITDERGRAVATCFREGDARRLAACWNACTGIDTDILENAQRNAAPQGFVFAKCREVDFLMQQRNELLNGRQVIGADLAVTKHQRDDLLSELTKLAARVEQIVLDDGSTPCTMGARAAIARVERPEAVTESEGGEA